MTSCVDPPLEEKKRRAAAWILKRQPKQYPAYREIAITTGFVISEEGYILTCRHGLLKKDGELCDLVSVDGERPDRSLPRNRVASHRTKLGTGDSPSIHHANRRRRTLRR